MKKKNNVRRVVGSLALAASTATLAGSPDDSQRFNDYWSPGKPSLSACKSPLLVGTPLGLPRCMQASNVLTRLQKLQDIAVMNGGNRAAAQPGYQASLDYVRTTLERAGYRVTIQAFPFTSYEPQGPGTLSALLPVPATYIWDKSKLYSEGTQAHRFYPWTLLVLPGALNGNARARSLRSSLPYARRERRRIFPQ